jgi:hypothetical protein
MLLALMSASARSTEGLESGTGARGLALPLLKRRVVGPTLLAAAMLALCLRDVTRHDKDHKPEYAHITDPPPPPRIPSAYDNPDDPNSKPAPCELPRPPMPAGKHFWPWS